MENPYLAVIYKKQRAVRKKYDRILSLQERIDEGKALNEEQVSFFTLVNK